MSPVASTLIIACGALAKEITALVSTHQWRHIQVTCLPADVHNYPERISVLVRQKIHAHREQYDRLFVAFADCGTGGELDRVLEEEGIERLPGAHCYEFYAGSKAFQSLANSEPGTFYLTDFLVKHFDRLVYRGLGLEAHPELLPMYFGNYRKLVFLAQTQDSELEEQAKIAAKQLGLEYEYRYTGFGELEETLVRLYVRQEDIRQESGTTYYRSMA